MLHRILIPLVLIAAITGCTTTERDVGVGAATGALIGGIVEGGEGALVGAGVGAVGGFLVRNLRNGFCQYRDRNGRLYTARC
ncbi:glycine zipper family protein [Chelativorans sp. M5D2P16]|uniref:glycine zipper family protein n=1 Tax=Chelativorans sp. M5D2P16 TaxID=3095678 RepID=UPI003A0FF832